MKTLSLKITAVPSEISPTLELLDEFFKHQGLDEKSRFKIQVVLAESLGNAIKHSLRGGSHRDTLRIDCETDGKQLTVTTRDNGLPLSETPSFTIPDADSQNGRGWPIIFNWMDNVEYYARRGVNYLELTKFLPLSKTN